MEYTISTVLNHIFPLFQHTKYSIECSKFPFKQLIRLIYFTPNIQTLKVQFISIEDTDYRNQLNICGGRIWL
jgi:hypothetical protein